MIRDDDLAWAQDILGRMRDSSAKEERVLARLVLHAHEQEQSVPLDAILASAPGAEPGGIEGLTDREFDSFTEAIERGRCPMSDRDPLADVLDAFISAAMPGTHDGTLAEDLARVTRDHIAAEIEATISDTPFQNKAAQWIREGKRIAARIARRT